MKKAAGGKNWTDAVTFELLTSSKSGDELSGRGGGGNGKRQERDESCGTRSICPTCPTTIVWGV